LEDEGLPSDKELIEVSENLECTPVLIPSTKEAHAPDLESTLVNFYGEPLDEESPNSEVEYLSSSHSEEEFSSLDSLMNCKEKMIICTGFVSV
jgi:hypothetical protein